MRDKHIHITAESQLLKLIYQTAEQELIINKNKVAATLWTKFFFYISLSILFYSALFFVSKSSLFIVCYILYGLSALLFAFNFAHDFSHGTIFVNKKWNDYCFIFIYAINGAHAEAWKLRHIHSHHYAPNVEDYDSDLQISSLIRVLPNSQYKWYHRFQHWYAPVIYTSYSLFWVFIKDFVLLFSKDEHSAKHNLSYHLSFWFQKIFYLVYLLVIPLLFSGFSWWIVLSGFLLMHICQSVFLLFTFFMTHHVESTQYPVTDKEGYIQSSWIMNQVKSSNDMHPFSPLANFILGGFNNHIAHHLFPHIHHMHYPRLSKILYRVLQDHNITPNRTSYIGGIVSHLRLLRKMSRRESSIAA